MLCGARGVESPSRDFINAINPPSVSTPAPAPARTLEDPDINLSAMAQEQQSPTGAPAATPSSKSNLVRLASLQIGDLPAHPELPDSDSSSADRPPLLSFLLTFLDDGAEFLSPSSFSKNFKHHSTKAAVPSASQVEVLTATIPASALADIEWTVDGSRAEGEGQPRRPSRSKPRSLGGGEYWVARKSIHRDVSSKDQGTPGNASWEEFIYGLRDDHSKHEADFTPTLYDAHRVVDWNDKIRELETLGKLKGQNEYTCCSMGIYEMCHAIPAPLSPRCFPVLVATASINANAFLAVTVPVNLGTRDVPAAFYSNGRNVREGGDAQQRKQAVMGVYAAVEAVRKDTPQPGQVEWIMATASDAKGNLPQWVQKMSIPGAVVKDVSYFMKWIKGVDDAEIRSVKVV